VFHTFHLQTHLHTDNEYVTVNDNNIHVRVFHYIKYQTSLLHVLNVRSRPLNILLQRSGNRQVVVLEDQSLHKARLAGSGRHYVLYRSVHPSVCPILMQTCTSGQRVRGMKRSTLGVRRSKVKDHTKPKIDLQSFLISWVE